MTHWSVLEGDCIESMREMPSGSVNTCVTSPPYFGLRDYGHDGHGRCEARAAVRWMRTQPGILRDRTGTHRRGGG